MADLSGTDLDRLLGEARETLESMRQGGGAAPDRPAAPRSEQLQGIGEAAGGRVAVTAVPGGRIDAVRLDPRVMRMASEELGEQLALAVNAALDDLRAKSAAAGTDQAVDTAALSRQVERLQNDGLRQMALIGQAITESLSRIGGAR